MKGNVDARHQLGCVQGQAGNEYRAMKHFIAASAGDQKSLDKVMQGFMQGFVTKDEYEKALRAHQERQGGEKWCPTQFPSIDPHAIETSGTSAGGLNSFCAGSVRMSSSNLSSISLQGLEKEEQDAIRLSNRLLRKKMRSLNVQILWRRRSKKL